MQDPERNSRSDDPRRRLSLFNRPSQQLKSTSQRGAKTSIRSLNPSFPQSRAIARGDEPTFLKATELTQHLVDKKLPGQARYFRQTRSGPAHSRHGRDDLGLPFYTNELSAVISFFNILPAFFEMIKEETTRCFRTTLFDKDGSDTGFVLSIKYFSWWLGTGSISLSHKRDSGEVRVLLLGLESDQFKIDIYDRLKSKQALTSHPFLVPLVVCDSLAKSLSSQLHTSSKRIFQLEQTIGVNDYGDNDLNAKTEPQQQPDLDFADINRSLNGELSRLANYEKFAKSQITLLETILADKVLSLDQKDFSFLIITQMREYGESLLGWNKELLARTECQQKIVDGQIQTLYNLLAQRDNKLNYTIAEASRRDSTAMKTIAIVTMVFLPGAYIATLFSMSMFNWHAASGEHVLSNNFWVYWAVTLPITTIVLLIWAAWSRPWKS
ncbi:hypothetical protein IFR05_012535 [Cadophora sp. M221]|nr:hypothetical protein IFR05_012535 [Cadophora sp. M221]